MPAHRPGITFTTRATKATKHGYPVIEQGFPGVAFKSTQAAPAYPTVANAEAATRIAVGEQFTIIHEGAVEFDDAHLPDGVRVGDPIYIKVDDNRLADAATATTGGELNNGYAKYGRLAELDSEAGRCTVNLYARSTF